MLVESLLLCVSKLNMVFHEVIEELPACVHSGGENAVDDLFFGLHCAPLL